MASTGGFSRYVLVTLSLLVSFGVCFAFYYASERSIDLANERRYESQLLANELRQTSDDLTTMVRSYVATSDHRYRQWFSDILKIRDGELPLPPDYHRVYWTYLEAGISPSGGPGTTPSGLLGRMRKGGFTDDEMFLLQIAKVRSDQLAAVETLAMDQAVSPDEAVRAQARALVYDQNYQEAKAGIMQPIDTFLQTVDRRTAREVSDALSRAQLLMAFLVTLGAAFIASLVATYQKLRRILGSPVDRVRSRIEALGTGDFGADEAVPPRHGDSIAGWLERTRLHLKDLYAQLTAARDQAESANRAKGTFLATMSHEIRTPLHSIIGMNYLLEHSEINQEQRTLVETSKVSAAQLLQMLNDVLDISKIEAGPLELESAPFSTRQLLVELEQNFSPLARQKGIELAFHLPDPLPAVVGDRLRVGQILSNLIGNALKFTDEGRVDVIVEADFAANDTLHWTIDVEDTGIGILPQARRRLFQPFQQADGSITRRFGGTGLGLSIAKSLADRMGGNLVYKPKEGGSRFRVSLELPLAVGEPNREPPPPPQEPPRFKGKCVLVVEDHAMNRTLMTSFLARREIEVIETSNGPQALAELDGSDLAIVDLHLPDMDGFELCRQMRGRLGSDFPLVACSAAVTATDKERAREAGFDTFLEKPVDPDELDEVLARHLGPALSE